MTTTTKAMKGGTRRRHRGRWGVPLPRSLGGENGSGKRGSINWEALGIAALLGWFSVALIWLVDRSPERIIDVMRRMQWKLSGLFG